MVNFTRNFGSVMTLSHLFFALLQVYSADEDLVQYDPKVRPCKALFSDVITRGGILVLDVDQIRQ